MQEALTIAPQLAVAVAIVGLVVWLQRSNRAAVAALRSETAAAAAPEPVAKRLDALDAGMARLTEQLAGVTVQIAKLATDVRWMRQSHRGGRSEGPES